MVLCICHIKLSISHYQPMGCLKAGFMAFAIHPARFAAANDANHFSSGTIWLKRYLHYSMMTSVGDKDVVILCNTELGRKSQHPGHRQPFIRPGNRV